MSYAIEPLIYTQFKGIRQYNGLNSGGIISALKCVNVELKETEIGASVSIKTADGNIIFKELPQGYKVISMFTSEQNGADRLFVYAETETKGTLFYLTLEENLITLIDDLTVTGQANGLTMTSSAFDVFVFTNGVEQKTVCLTEDVAYEDVVRGHNPIKFADGYIATIEAVDYLGREVKWIAMTEWNGFLVVASKSGVNSSHQNDIYTWNENPQDVADAWYIDFSKKVTALASFTGGLYIFTHDDCSLLNQTPNDTVNSRLTTSAGIGCFSYSSITKHDLYLFFYDDTQKNIYYLNATDTTGQTRPTGPVAKEVQNYFNGIKTFKMFSCVRNNKNEIWCLINEKILIYDYTQQEWIERKEQDIKGLCLIDSNIYSGDSSGKIYVEGVNHNFDGRVFDAVYETTLINLGTNTNMKKQKTPILLTLDTNYTNDFFIQLIVNSKEKTPKRVKVSNANKSKYTDDEAEDKENVYGGEVQLKNDNGYLLFLDAEENKYYYKEGVLYTENGDATELELYEVTPIYTDEFVDKAVFVMETIYNKRVVEISTPQTWYTLGIRLYTDRANQGFFINSIELKNLKGKTKTKGR